MRSVMNGHRLIQVLTHQYSASRHAEAKRLFWNLEAPAFISHRVVVVDDAVMLLGEDLVQIVTRISQKGRPGLLRFNTEISIVQSDPLVSEKFIGRFHRCDCAEATLLRHA